MQGFCQCISIILRSRIRCLDCCTRALNRIKNGLDELRILIKPISKIYCDSNALVNFIKDEGEPKGLRHIQLRLYAARDDYAMGKMELHHISGEKMPADPLTKVKDVERNIQHFSEVSY